MQPTEALSPPGRVSALHLHPKLPGDPMVRVARFEVVAEMGIVGNHRYFGRKSRTTGQPTVRQVTLIEREQIDEHAQALTLDEITPGAVRANIETVGIQLVPLLGKRIAIGGAVLLLREARTPCAKMDAVCQGLRALMEGSRQGVLAQVVQSGQISEGDLVRIQEEPR